MRATTRVKAKDTRIPWLQLLLVAMVTWLAAGCGPQDDPLVITFDDPSIETPQSDTLPQPMPGDFSG